MAATGVDAPIAAFPVGKKGLLFGVEVEVLGWARWRTHDGYPYHEVALRTADAEAWTLEVDGGHCILFKDVPAGKVTWGTPDEHDNGKKVTLDGTKRVAFPAGKALLEKQEGEYWKDVEPGDVIVNRSYFSRPTVLSASLILDDEDGDAQWEWSEGVYLDRGDVAASFGEEVPHPSEPHGARPYPYTTWGKALHHSFLAMGVLGAVGLGAMGNTSVANAILQEVVEVNMAAEDPAAATEGEVFIGELTLSKPTVVGVVVSAPSIMDAWFNATVLIEDPPPADATPETYEPSAAKGRVSAELWHESGFDDEGYWSEQSGSTKHGFRVPPGTYIVRMVYDHSPGGAVGPVTVSVVDSYVDTSPLWTLTILGFVLALIAWIVRAAQWNKVLVDVGLRVSND